MGYDFNLKMHAEIAHCVRNDSKGGLKTVDMLEALVSLRGAQQRGNLSEKYSLVFPLCEFCNSFVPSRDSDSLVQFGS